MLVGDTFEVTSGSCEVRGVVDGRFVVRIRSRVRDTEAYEIWTDRELIRRVEAHQARAGDMAKSA